jgi:outer membrane lipoprotein SlyB
VPDGSPNQATVIRPAGSVACRHFGSVPGNRQTGGRRGTVGAIVRVVRDLLIPALMKTYTCACIVGLALTVAGCATMGGYQPTVDPYNDPYASRIPRDEAECRELALNASGGTAKQSAIGAAVGGLIGAASGAAIGAAAGNPGAGAAIGAATGGLGGGTFEGITAEQRFKTAFQTCLRERGHRVLD